MALQLDFEPHSRYKGAAIRCNAGTLAMFDGSREKWEAVYENGMTGHLDYFEADTLKELKHNITRYLDSRKARDRENRRLLREASV